MIVVQLLTEIDTSTPSAVTVWPWYIYHVKSIPKAVLNLRPLFNRHVNVPSWPRTEI